MGHYWNVLSLHCQAGKNFGGSKKEVATKGLENPARWLNERKRRNKTRGTNWVSKLCRSRKLNFQQTDQSRRRETKKGRREERKTNVDVAKNPPRKTTENRERKTRRTRGE